MIMRIEELAHSLLSKGRNNTLDHRLFFFQMNVRGAPLMGSSGVDKN
jgi:hypothetical protein